MLASLLCCTHIFFNIQIMTMTVFGFMAFQAASFYLAFYMQEIRRWDALTIAVHLLPQVIAGRKCPLPLIYESSYRP